ncbi:unnamed protein product [Effrenium voratum]|nr:unnamed protein product [Effrenium voratum]
MAVLLHLLAFAQTLAVREIRFHRAQDPSLELDPETASSHVDGIAQLVLQLVDNQTVDKEVYEYDIARSGQICACWGFSDPDSCRSGSCVGHSRSGVTPVLSDTFVRGRASSGQRFECLWGHARSCQKRAQFVRGTAANQHGKKRRREP